MRDQKVGLLLDKYLSNQVDRGKIKAMSDESKQVESKINELRILWESNRIPEIHRFVKIK